MFMFAGVSSPDFLNALGAIEIFVLAVLVPLFLALFLTRQKLLKRIVLFALMVSGVYAAEIWWSSAAQPQKSAALAIQQLDSNNAHAIEMRAFEAGKDAAHLGAFAAVLLAASVCFGGYVRPLLEKAKGRLAKLSALFAVLALLPLTGCIKPYDRPEYHEIDTSETGFLIPLEGEGLQQARFASEEYLKQRKVAAKRVQVTHRWSQEGRRPNDGRWISTVRLVKVNRSPVTREWTTPQGPSTVGQNLRGGANDKAIWIESGDSVGFSMGFTCTAFISEDDAAKFLYWYPSGSLADMMDRELRGRIQQAAAEVAAKYPLDSLRSRKQEIADAVKADVTKFFASRGVTVTTVGMFGGMTYENPEIQKSIDQTFIAQQLKVVAEAKFEAQKKENERIELEANAIAEKARREAQGLADARRLAAAAEGEAIREVNRALNETQQVPLLSQLKALEVEKARVEKWDGKYPTYYMGSGFGSPNLLLQMPGADSGQARR
jgi:hypothetical protein